MIKFTFKVNENKVLAAWLVNNCIDGYEITMPEDKLVKEFKMKNDL